MCVCVNACPLSGMGARAWCMEARGGHLSFSLLHSAETESLTEPGARQAVILPLPQTLSAGVTHAWITPSFLLTWALGI